MKKFVIVGTQRTGSSALAEALGMHPGVACGWEWSTRVPWHHKLKAPERALEGDFSLLCASERAHMERIFSPSLDWIGYRSLFRSSDKWLFAPRFNVGLFADRLEGHLKWFARQRDLHILHIIRRDNIEWLKSKYAAHATHAYVGKEYPDGLKIYVPIRTSIRRLLAKNWVDTRLSRLSQTNPYLAITYEVFLNDRNRVLAGARGFLGLNPVALDQAVAKIVRQSTGDASRYISNHESLRLALEKHQLLTSSSAEMKVTEL